MKCPPSFSIMHFLHSIVEQMLIWQSSNIVSNSFVSLSSWHVYKQTAEVLKGNWKSHAGVTFWSCSNSVYMKVVLCVDLAQSYKKAVEDNSCVAMNKLSRLTLCLYTFWLKGVQGFTASLLYSMIHYCPSTWNMSVTSLQVCY